MKKLLFILLISTITVSLKAQDIKIDEPEFNDEIVFADDTIGLGQKLETTKMSVKAKATIVRLLTGVGKVKVSVSVRDATSYVKIPKGNTLQFIYKATDNTIAPSKAIELIRFESKNNSRIAIIAESGTYTGSSTGDMGYVNFSATKYGTSSYLITVTDLAAGEYGFSLGKESTKIIHMFTVE